jgi:tetratricopeptide (TPR) repeat protein
LVVSPDGQWLVAGTPTTVEVWQRADASAAATAPRNGHSAENVYSGQGRPNNLALTYLDSGNAKVAKGDSDAAIADYTRALQIDPAYAAAYNNRGYAKHVKRDLDGAIEDYTRALKLDPQFAFAYTSRGIARQAKGDLKGALEDYTRAVEADHNYAPAYYNRGIAKSANNDLDGALIDYTRALDIDPKYSAAYFRRGTTKSAKRDFGAAVTDFLRTTALNPSDEDADYATLYKWLTEARLGRRQEATRELASFAARRKDEHANPWHITIAEFLTGQHQEAEFLAIGQASDPKTIKGRLCEAYFFAGAVRLLNEDKNGALELFRKSVATGETGNSEYASALAEMWWLR